MECKAQGINQLSYLYLVEPFNWDLCLDTTQAPTVTWNDTIAADAEVWATYLADNNVFQHASNLNQLDQGENLYLVSVQPTEPCTDATRLSTRRSRITILTSLDFPAKLVISRR